MLMVDLSDTYSADIGRQGVSPEERQEELDSTVRDIRVILATQDDLGDTALVAAQSGSLEALAAAGEELLALHVKFAVKYRHFMGLWLRPGNQGGTVPCEEPLAPWRSRPAGTSRWDRSRD
jgi:hypothetical protein